MILKTPLPADSAPADQDPVALRPLCWIEIPVSNIRAAADRLFQLFGWTVQAPSTSSFALLMTGNREPIGVSLVLRETLGANNEPMTTLIGANVGSERIEDVYARALSLGFMPVEQPRAIPEAGHGMRAVLRDPDGNLFGLWRD